MTIAVTGATGHLGRLVLTSLLDRGVAEPLVAVVRDASRAADLAARGVDLRVAAYEDRPALDPALADVDTLLLVSGNEVGRRVEQHRTVLEAAAAAGVRRVVYTSAPRADDTTLVLAPEHAATEELVRTAGPAWTIARNNWYHENYLQQLGAVRETGTLVAAAGDGRVASASRRDYAEGLAAVLLDDGLAGQVLELAGDVAWTYDDLAAALSGPAGREVVYQPVDPGALVQRLVGAGLDEATARFVAALDVNVAEGTLDGADGTLSRLLGRPTTPLAQGLADPS